MTLYPVLEDGSGANLKYFHHRKNKDKYVRKCMLISFIYLFCNLYIYQNVRVDTISIKKFYQSNILKIK